MNLSEPFIKRPIATILLMVALTLVGLCAFRLLPIASLPEIEYPTIRVTTFYPGASPEITASLVTAPLEKQFGQMTGLTQMTSTSSTKSSLIDLKFSLNMNLDVAEQQVQAAMNAAQTYLPTNLQSLPIYKKMNPADAPILSLAVTSKTVPLTQVEDYVEIHMLQHLSQVMGVGLVNISGGHRPCVRIQCNHLLLASYGLNLEDLRTILTTASTNNPKGTFEGQQLSYTINANDQLLEPKEFQNLIITYKNGNPVRLKDVATVTLEAEDKYQAAWINEKPAIILNIYKQPGANVITVADEINKLLPKLTESKNNNIEIDLLVDRTINIRASIEHAIIDLYFSIILVVFVFFVFFKNISTTFIPAIVIPISLIASFSAMYAFGFSINNLSLMALTISTGFVVDDAIVMLENIMRYIENGETPLNAALKGAKQIGFTIISLTISIIAVFIPIFFMTDLIGSLFREFSCVLTITILISAFISLTLTPMLCSRLLKTSNTTSYEKKNNHFFDALQAFYKKTLHYVLQHQTNTLVATIFIFLMTLVLFYYIPKSLFPIQDTSIIQGIFQTDQSISFQQMVAQQQNLEKHLMKDPDVLSISSFMGIDGENTTLNSGRFLINLKPKNQRNKNITQIIDRLQSTIKFPQIKLYMQPLQDLSINDRQSHCQYQFSLSAPNEEDVVYWGNKVREELEKTQKFSSLTSDQQNKGLKKELLFNRDTMARLGLTMEQVSNTLYDAFGQRQILTLFTQVNQYHVVLEVMPELLKKTSIFDQIYIVSPAKGPVPLSMFTKISQRYGPLTITRQGQFPVTTLSFNLAENVSLGDAIDLINQKMSDLKIPAYVRTQFEGVAKVFQNSLDNEGWLLIAAFIVVYIVLGILYESLIHPITILSTLPSAGVGALMALFLVKQDLTIIAIIGMILLIGIVKKNAILVIDFALEQERLYHKPPQEAIFDACLMRLRPILMTTMAAILGAVPLSLSFGVGAELRQPLGVILISGLALSQLFTLYTTPVIYLAFDRLSKKIKRHLNPYVNHASSVDLSP